MPDQAGALSRWWEERPGERFWLEATDRDDIGADLRAPAVDGGGRPNWRYDLFKSAQIGDIVFHYDKNPSSQGIVGFSTIAGPWQPAPIIWAARGSYARERGDTPVQRPGYMVPLASFTPVPIITLAELRRAEPSLRTMLNRLVATLKPRTPVYFPFELTDVRHLRLLQGYAWKLPAEFIALFPALRHLATTEPLPTAASAPSSRNPPWSRDELILALDLYVRVSGKQVSHRSPEINELSKLLNQLQRILTPGQEASATLRNENGVYMKLMNFRRFDPEFIAQGHVGLARGNSLEEAVWKEFVQDHRRLGAVAEALRAAITTPIGATLSALLDDGAEAVEGRLLTRLHRYRERDRKLVERKKAQALKQAGQLSCEVCGFDFRKRYGERGEGFIECHHLTPLHTLTEAATVHLDDLGSVDKADP